MGYSLDLFIQPVDENLKCGICHEVTPFHKFLHLFSPFIACATMKLSFRWNMSWGLVVSNPFFSCCCLGWVDVCLFVLFAHVVIVLLLLLLLPLLKFFVGCCCCCYCCWLCFGCCCYCCWLCFVCCCTRLFPFLCCCVVVLCCCGCCVLLCCWL